MEILVVGAGAMGRWLGTALREDAPEPVDLAFADADPAAATAAADSVGGRAVATDTDEQFDGVCLAVPMPAVGDAIRRYADRADGALFDVSGTMTTPIEVMCEVAPDRERVSLHPLFAPANEPGNVPLVPDATGPVTDSVRAALDARGNDLFETTAAEHDEAMETVQARTHAAVLAYALAAKEVDERFHTPISSELDALAGQVTDGEARVYTDIQMAFDGAEDVAAAARQIADADAETFERLYDDAGER
ncbi:prephenate dehydrogenase/arogenate dehydrogenase family protein [Salinibaculum rarum]|uniref:prephenate dehydrogenase/arogenate dehydrogenase family protein n=1 Tax=Salinibaculum rarum TaxID=3058903 RepID=UPI00265DBAC5|nr:prephenate dehydrogenase/arogenate dehydrogenase family protein [Salinibaculum sp. KK48]